MAISSNYAGFEATNIMLQAQKEEDTLRLGLITVVPNVGYKLNLRNLDVTLGVVDYSCGTSAATDAVDYSEKVLTLSKFKNEFEVCKEDFRPTWSGESMGASAFNDQTPSDISEAIVASTQAKLAQWFEDQIWNGAGTAGTMSGLITQFAADGDIVKANNGITAIGAAITKANVDDAFDAATAAMPYSLRRKDVKFVVSPDVADAYTKFLIENGAANGLGGDANTGMVYGRYTVESVNGLPDNTIVIFEKENITLGLGLANDADSIRIKDMDEVDFSGNVLYKSVFGGAVGYSYGSEIVWLLSTTA
tara:strand:+ start:11144 stop:12061 length:918 start_codon:yes stop_codon:yes gene_type:complete